MPTVRLLVPVVHHRLLFHTNTLCAEGSVVEIWSEFEPPQIIGLAVLVEMLDEQGQGDLIADLDAHIRLCHVVPERIR